MILCACPAVEGTQIWFMIVVVFAFLGTVFLSLYYLCVDQLVKGCNINWSQAVSTVQRCTHLSLFDIKKTIK